MPETDKPLLAHLLRRAGFGATFQELDRYSQLRYEAVVNQLLHPELQPAIEEDVLERYYIDWKESRNIEGALTESVYRMNAYAGGRPLQEKIALFWHGVFATGLAKVLHEKTMLNQIDLFREQGLGNFRELLVGLAKDPAMIFWLDNNFNHKDAPNENWGRELLELFSLGVGMDGQENFTEGDVQSAARAFTGWTIDDDNVTSFPFGKLPWRFRYLPDDHDEEEKTFLGHTGNFNGEDIIAIIVKQESTARFLATRLFQFFAADEVSKAGENAVEAMVATYFLSGYKISDMLQTLFLSDYFKSEEARFARVKGPVEMVVGAIRMAGNYQNPSLGIEKVSDNMFFMGQGLLRPPTVEGWHEGVEWIDSGALVERVNFVAKVLSDVKSPGVRSIIDWLEAGADDGVLNPSDLADGCLDLLGPIQVSDETRSVLVDYAARHGDLDLNGHQPGDQAEQRVGNMLRLVAATREYQLA